MPAVQPYRNLGGFPLTAVADPDGRNPFGSGFATIIIDTMAAFRADVALAELYHVVITGQAGSVFQIYLNRLLWDYVLVGSNGWDPAQPMPCRSGDKIYFYFNQPFAQLPVPTCVAWFRQPLAYQS
jgi:hypothetical protein